MEDLVSSEVSSEDQPTGERWDPLGAPNDSEEEDCKSPKLENEFCDHQYVQ